MKKKQEKIEMEIKTNWSLFFWGGGDKCNVQLQKRGLRRFPNKKIQNLLKSQIGCHVEGKYLFKNQISFIRNEN